MRQSLSSVLFMASHERLSDVPAGGKRPRFGWRQWLLATLFLFGAAQPAVAQSARPDIVVFIADDLGAEDVAPYGSRDAITPNVSLLARSGVAFDRAYVASPSCAPSRAALLTGLMPARNGVEPNHAKPRSWTRKLPAYLQELGYEVVAFGKVAHYREAKLYGFDHSAHDGFHDHAAVPAAVDWLRRRTGTKPVALFVGSNWPHVPWPPKAAGYEPGKVQLPPKSVDTPITRDARARYLTAVSAMDSELGAVLDAVDQELGHDTLVLFSSDHGAQWPFGKWNLYETGIRTPLIVRWPARAPEGIRTDAMVSWVDILPTLVEAAGGKPPADLDGRSFLPVLRGTARDHRDELFATHTGDAAVNVFPMRSVRVGKWKYIANLEPGWTYTTHIDRWIARTDSGKYFPSWRRAAGADERAEQVVARYYRRPAEELYDLDADPTESNNLATDPAHAPTMADLRARLARWRTEQGDTGRVYAAPILERQPIDGDPSREP